MYQSIFFLFLLFSFELLAVDVSEFLGGGYELKAVQGEICRDSIEISLDEKTNIMSLDFVDPGQDVFATEKFNLSELKKFGDKKVRKYDEGEMKVKVVTKVEQNIMPDGIKLTVETFKRKKKPFAPYYMTALRVLRLGRYIDEGKVLFIRFDSQDLNEEGQVTNFAGCNYSKAAE